MFWANIGIIGGLGMVEGLGERLSVVSSVAMSQLKGRERDLRALCPIDYEIGIYEAFECVDLSEC